ncbi:hypothetical protein [Marinobacter sp. OP 3.4]|uniref:hypothetical protein n=1 Tax=Marinobacter sp. OP 3.4 TaxID=3076501 RepID=UPI002E1FC8C7
MTRHPNCKPEQIMRPVAVSMSQQSRRSARAEIELLTQDFVANGGKVTELPSQQASTITRPAFNDMPAEFGEDAA